jgi:hypothetical protein
LTDSSELLRLEVVNQRSVVSSQLSSMRVYLSGDLTNKRTILKSELAEVVLVAIVLEPLSVPDALDGGVMAADVHCQVDWTGPVKQDGV